MGGEGDEGSVKALELHERWRVSVRDGRLSWGEGRGQVLVTYGGAVGPKLRFCPSSPCCPWPARRLRRSRNSCRMVVSCCCPKSQFPFIEIPQAVGPAQPSHLALGTSLSSQSCHSSSSHWFSTCSFLHSLLVQTAFKSLIQDSFLHITQNPPQ